MRIVKEKFKTDRNNKLYWGRVYFIADNREAKTKLIWAMSFERVRRQLLAEIWREDEVDRLVNKIVVFEHKNLGRKIFSAPTRIAAFGINPEEEAALRVYLQEQEKRDRCG